MLKSDGAQPLPFFFVGKTITKSRIARYAKTKHPILSKEMNKPDTKSIWYTKEHIAFLLTEMDKAEADGLRIYFGAYGEQENYSGQTCLLMVMTKPGLHNDGHTDISIEDEQDFQARAVNESKSRDFNVGNPCPPMCDYIGDDDDGEG
jgi:hypothetical protein